MGEMILITGAGGYLGQATLAQAKARGLPVRAHLRAGSLPETDCVTGDLSHLPASAMEGITTVIHCAARLSGTDADQQADTVEATRHLFELATQSGVKRLVLAGSFSVYSGNVPVGSVVDEASPIEPTPQLRDAYTRAKIRQEQTARQARGDAGLWILRLGAIWGPQRLWNGHLGLAAGPFAFRIGSVGEIPLLHVQNAAAALVQAATIEPDGVEVINVVDDDRPDRTRYLRALAQGGWPRLIVPVPYRAMEALARLGLPRPGLLRASVLRARMRPLRYSNRRAKDRLDWRPEGRFEDLMEAAR